MQKDLGKTTLGMDANLEAVLAYALGWVTGIVFLVLEKENKFVRFHAYQSLFVFIGLTLAVIVLTLLPLAGWVLIPAVYVLELILWVVLMVKAWQGEAFKLPAAGEWAEKYSSK